MSDCKELITFLGDYLAHELPPERNLEFERHLAICESCVAYLASYEATIRMARSAVEPTSLTVEEMPADLVHAILASIDKRS